MPILRLYESLQAIALAEYADIVDQARVLTLTMGDPLKLRLDVVDGSLIDVFLSASGKYSYHWERRLTSAGDLYRHDNAPHDKWRYVRTYPRHFHDGSEGNVVESHISSVPEQALREFLFFVRAKLLAPR
jgi:hypothetical protein